MSGLRAQEIPNRGTEAPLFARESPIGTLEYRPGRGLSVGETGLTVGGYSSLFFVRDEGAPGQFTFNNLSLFLAWDPHPRIHGFAELELEHLVDVDTDGDVTGEHARFRVERAYEDFSLLEAVNLRVGKFLTPVGRWNVIHAQPLVWTTSRPLTSELLFDQNTTGGQLFGTFFDGGAAVTYRLIGQFVNQLEPRPQLVHQDRSAGTRIELTLADGLELGATYLAHRSDDREWHHLGGFDLLWQIDRLEVLSETALDEGERNQWGTFVQPVYEVFPRWYAVARYEHFNRRSREVELFDPGIAFRPYPTVVLKAEYLFADRRSTIARPGFKSSFSILF